MLQLQNHTPFAATLLPLADEEGIDSLYINVRATFKIGAQWVLAEKQLPPQAEDVYWGEPGASSLKYASEVHLGKAATDVVMIGDACAPGCAPVRQLDVALAVGGLQKTVRVYGDRYWQNGCISTPVPFKTMPLIYENAFGGSVVDGESQQTVAAEERNPVGKGFAGPRSSRDLEGLVLPNLEDPRQLIRSRKDMPEPACFGFRAPNWQPRVRYAGTYDERWLSERAPYMPSDYNPLFNNAAPPGLVSNGFLTGGEQVVIQNMHPSGELSFNLPYIKMIAQVEVGNSRERPALQLETVLIEPNQLQLSLTWKAKVRCEKNILKVKQVSLNLSR
jgi:hypothetical protein